MRSGFLIIFCILLSRAYSQYGLAVGSAFDNYSNWEGQLDKAGIAANYPVSLGIYAHYDVLRNENAQQLLSVGADFITSQWGQNASKKVDFRLKAGYHFHPFNLDGDCDCPSFYQQGNWFSRGFKLGVNVGAGMVKFNDDSFKPYGFGEVRLSINFPIGKQYNVYPMVMYTITSKINNQERFIAPISSPLNALTIGIGISREHIKRRK